MFLLRGSATTLEDLELHKAQRHETQRKARHNPGKEDEQTRGPSIDEPQRRPESDALLIENYIVGEEHRPSKGKRIQPKHLSGFSGLQLGRGGARQLKKICEREEVTAFVLLSSEEYIHAVEFSVVNESCTLDVSGVFGSTVWILLICLS